MTKYFENFPVITYNGKQVRDITRRNQFIKSISTNPLLFLPYTVKENERAEDIAQFYYGSTDYVWLVYLANNIIDPYHQWPKDEATFNNYLIEKYGPKSGKEGQEVIEWLTQEGNEDAIYYYYKEV